MKYKMILKLLIIYCSIFYVSAHPQRSTKCMTGYMTDVQTWVDEKGSLHPNLDDVENSIDLSGSHNPVPALHKKISSIRAPKRYVKYLSLARCNLKRVPPVFLLRDQHRRPLAANLQYLSLFGNNFLRSQSGSGDHFSLHFNATNAVELNMGNAIQLQGASVWSSSFTSVTFHKLLELDLRACSIQMLGPHLFTGMPHLRALYIGENQIYFIDSTAFIGLKNLVHLDFSRNQAFDENGNPRNLLSDDYYGFNNLVNLMSLDMSYTKLTQRNLGLIMSLGKSLKSLSLCETGLNSLQDEIFNKTSLEVLDLSGNNGILNTNKVLKGLERKLVVLYAQEVGLQSMNLFVNFTRLEILQLSYNEINRVSLVVADTVTSLKVLDLKKNRVSAWFEGTFSLMPQLQYLSLEHNNINIITEDMAEDMMYVDFIALSGNYIVCNCHVKDFYKMAAKNEMTRNVSLIKIPDNQLAKNGYVYYNSIIENRTVIKLDCNDSDCYDDIGTSGRFRLVDYSPGAYKCLTVPESRTVPISEVFSCGRLARETDYEHDLEMGKKKLLALLAIPCVLLPMALMFVFRRHLRYFFITMRNSAMLSLINEKNVVDDNTIFNYDVFVSYCNEDREWVLDHLLPHIETECSISACLHERDFLVGLSILENIVSCMDRSRSIMLIISQRFLLSQWCQFEMHLAQHRLLETRREDLTLVLLEDIPRRLRPNTLHYLMLTKTYIVWPKEESERHIFWRRLKKTLISQKTKPTENVSLA